MIITRYDLVNLFIPSIKASWIPSDEIWCLEYWNIKKGSLVTLIVRYHWRKGVHMASELWGIFLRTIFVYFFIFVMMRLMGKREIGKLSTFDLVVSFMIADISAISLEGLDRPLLNGLVPIVTIVGLQIILSFIFLKWKNVRSWAEGKPSIIINQGKIDKEVMAQTRYNIDDLMMQLREKSIADVRDVEFAILETSGKLSVFPKSEKMALTVEDLPSKKKKSPFRLPVPLVIEGKIQEQELRKIGKNPVWLKQQLQQRGYSEIASIFYASVNQQGEFYVDVYDNN